MANPWMNVDGRSTYLREYRRLEEEAGRMDLMIQRGRKSM